MMPRLRALLVLAMAMAMVLYAANGSAQTSTVRPSTDAACGSTASENACGLDEPLDAGADVGAASKEPGTATLLFFWGVGCPHCEEAKPVIEALSKENPGVRVEAIEVRKDAEGRRRFLDTMKRLEASAVGVPAFVVGNAYVVGYKKGETDAQLRALVQSGQNLSDAGGPSSSVGPAREVAIPWFGNVNPSTVSLPGLTLGMGLADGLNPCAIWVLVVLLGILLHVEKTSRMILYAGTFVVMSGVVYFVFMAAWATLFELVGLSRVVTMVLGVALLGMGLVNLKDVVWFKKGPSLVIPDKVKPGLFRRMRAIAGAATTPAALGGIAVLAFVVNLVELGCTLGLPAIYTRILALRGLSTGARFGYLALYNVAYVVPLVTVVSVFVVLKRKLVMTDRIARVLKGVSGFLLVTFGALFLLAPDLLTGG